MNDKIKAIEERHERENEYGSGIESYQYSWEHAHLNRGTLIEEYRLLEGRLEAAEDKTEAWKGAYDVAVLETEAAKKLAQDYFEQCGVTLDRLEAAEQTRLGLLKRLAVLDAKDRAAEAKMCGGLPTVGGHDDCHASQFKKTIRDLEAVMPVWTKITDDPDTWPEDGNYLWAYRSVGVGGGWLHATFEVSMMRVIADMAVDTRWRPLTDIDYPPETL